MFTCTVVNGDSLLSVREPAGPITEPLAGPGPDSSGLVTAPDEYRPATSGAATQPASAPEDLTTRPASARPQPPQGAAAPVISAEAGYEQPAGSGNPAIRTAASEQPTHASAPSSQTADPPRGGPFDGLLGSAFDVAQELPR
ncbi:MAG: hypothetical protein ACRDSR_07480 [Pseudonocardiaceae bacterium]